MNEFLLHSFIATMTYNAKITMILKKMMKIIIKKLMIKNSIFAIIITKINYIYNFYLYKAIL